MRRFLLILAALICTAQACAGPYLGGSSAGPAALTITTLSPLAAATIGVPYSTTMGATGGSLPYTWTLLSAAPNTGNWLSFTNPTAGTLSGTPGTAETESLTIRVADAAGHMTQGPFALLVQSVSGLTITTPSLPLAYTGAAYSVQLQASGGSGNYAFSRVSMTPNNDLWAMVTPSGVVLGTPEAVETETATFQVTDLSTGATAQKSFSWQVASQGALTVQSSTSLPNATSGGYYAFPIAISGGSGHYDVQWNPVQPWWVTPDGWIEGTPTSTGSQTFTSITVTDSEGNSVTYSPSVTIDSALRIASVDASTGYLRLPDAHVGDYYRAQVLSHGGSGSVTYSASGLPSWATLSSSGLITGTPTLSGAVAINLTATDGASHTATATGIANVGNSTTVSRPSYNSSPSNGLFTLNGQLYDPNGHAFQMAGVDRNHFDSQTWAGPASGALADVNVVRGFNGFGQYTQTAAEMAAQVTNEYATNGITTIITVPAFQTSFTGSMNAAGTVLTVSSIDSTLSSANAGIIVWGSDPTNCGVNGSVALSSGGCIVGQLTGSPGSFGTYSVYQGTSNASGAMTLTGGTSGNTDPDAIVASTNMLGSVYAGGLDGVQSDILINIANEWNGSSESAWLNAYAAAIAALRTDGYTAPLVIDLPNLAEDFNVLANGDAATLLADDPLKNLEFSVHLYNTTSTLGHITSITQASNAVITFNSQANANPFAYPQLSNPSGQVCVSGVAGMTQINGQCLTVTGYGGSRGAWTLTTSLNSSSYTPYSSGGTVYDGNFYTERMQSLAMYKAQGLPVMIGEYGPPGPPATSDCTGNEMNNQSVGLSAFTASAIAYGLPWMVWAWDDHVYGDGSNPFRCWFGDTLQGPGTYVQSTPSDLTAAGMDSILNPRTGFISQAVPSTYLH